MTTMIERVARVIDPSCWEIPEEDYPAERARREAKQFSSLAAAKRAIDAMRGLPPTMADAAYQRMLMGRCSTEEEARQLFAEGWQAAIDAALNEQEAG